MGGNFRVRLGLGRCRWLQWRRLSSGWVSPSFWLVLSRLLPTIGWFGLFLISLRTVLVSFCVCPFRARA